MFYNEWLHPNYKYTNDGSAEDNYKDTNNIVHHTFKKNSSSAEIHTFSISLILFTECTSFMVPSGYSPENKNGITNVI